MLPHLIRFCWNKVLSLESCRDCAVDGVGGGGGDCIGFDGCGGGDNGCGGDGGGDSGGDDIKAVGDDSEQDGGEVCDGGAGDADGSGDGQDCRKYFVGLHSSFRIL